MAKRRRDPARDRAHFFGFGPRHKEVEFMRQRLAEFHRFVRETSELFGDAFTLTMIGNSIADLGYPSDAVHRLAKRAKD